MRSFSTDNFTFIDFTEMDDSMSRKVWECRNLPEIRKWMVNQDPIPYDSHVKFVESLKGRSDSIYFYVFQEDSFIGSINLHFEDVNTAERGIYIHPNYWGKKLAKKICYEFYPLIMKEFGLKEITTKVLKENVGSNALEYSIGSIKVAEDDKFNYYMFNHNRC